MRILPASSVLLLVACAAALVLGGCGLGAGPAPSAVRLLVTRDFGAQTLHPSGPLGLRGQETVMSLLRRNYSVNTRYGGGFVQSVESLSGGQEAGEPVDWFYYVNGVEAPEGAAATNVNPGDHIWWDRHDWSQTADIPAVVGSFPEPFLNGIGGKRLPVRVECIDVSGTSCQTVRARLRALQVPAAVAAFGGGGAPKTLRVLVGPWDRVGGDLDVHGIERGPRASGVYARFAPSGKQLTLLDQNGRSVRVLGAGAGLIAATSEGEDAPVWVITGTDDLGVQRAAQGFDEATLARRFAVALTSQGAQALPDRGG